MEMDSSVRLSVRKEIDVVSALGADDFAAKVLSVMPSDAKSANLGVGRILNDYSIMMVTRYVLCDIFEDGKETLPDGSVLNKYHIEVKSGKKSSRIADAVYCIMFLLCFWFLGNYFKYGFNVLFLVLSVLLIIAAAYLMLSTSRRDFGAKESEQIAAALEKL